MKIKMTTRTTSFEDLADGDVFEFGGNFYMKVIFSEYFKQPYSNTSGCVRLTDGLLMFTYPAENLKRLNGTFIAE